ncbi:META domain-containing protein [Nitrobacter sp.]|uniref:META domain-containing protein n=1 Tax=Nitrobacter sp. TaxID=29420 RepID=UPI003F64F541
MAARFGFRSGVIAAVVAIASVGVGPASAQDGFPFGLEMTLDAPPQPGSKRVPSLDVGDSGEARLELWCKGGKGQFSVAGNTIIFAAGPLEDRACPPETAKADDDLLAALSAVTTWTRQGDEISFVGPTTLRFHLNTN